MKLKFKGDQAFQTEAVNAVCDLFTGQGVSSETFSVVKYEQQLNLLTQNELGIGNTINIQNSDILMNMNRIQRRNNLPKTQDMYPFSHHKKGDLQFCIEMETGTGKTYVYTKTIFELNKRYGFTKFIVVVPSVAIREGVYKSFSITAEHFAQHYDNKPCRFFIYNSAKLSDVRRFATSTNIEIMIINIDAFKKAENIINQEQDKLNGESAMNFIKDTRPIVIIDEPQSVDNTPKSKEAIASLNPLCVLKYSATHREKTNLLYRLTPVDAYEMGLVKQIVVWSNSVEDDHNRAYISLKDVSMDIGANGSGVNFRAKIEIDVQNDKGEVKRKTITVKQGDDLFELSNKRPVYENWVIEGIDATKNRECLEFTNTEKLKLGKSIGTSADEDSLKRTQILRTVEAHFDNELRLTDKGIKVLSLFFIDKVDKYRDKDGNKGEYAIWFEEIYNELMQKEKYAVLKEKFATSVTNSHNGYFSQDKKGVFKDTKGDTIADFDTYNTIMRDKEWLLSFDCPLRFIFSHSTLKEGWDNPNVFQVCTLIEQKSTFTARQKVGRGLRLPVNQQGERIEDKNINILQVMANESFAGFVDKLQKEIEAETGVKFGVFQLSYLVGQTYEERIETVSEIGEMQAKEVVQTLVSKGIIDEIGNLNKNADIEEIDVPVEIKAVISQNKPVTVETLASTIITETVIEEKTISYDEAVEILEDMKEKKLIKKDGTMTTTMKEQLKNGTLDLGQTYSDAITCAILNAAKQVDVKLPIRDKSREVTVKLKKEVMISPEFLELWDKIKQKTAYRVNIDREKLISQCLADFKKMPKIAKPKILSQSANINIVDSGVTHTERGSRDITLDSIYTVLPDIVRVIATKTLLKRSTVAHILKNSGRTFEFIENPQAFTEAALEIIAKNRHSLAIDGIKYVKLAGEEYYIQEIFEAEELLANLDRNAVNVENSVYDHVRYDSGIERSFAQSLDNDPDVKMFFKIPSSFKIDTPIGTYNPDWAVYLEKNGETKLYFVFETKGTTDLFGINDYEKLKIHCGKAHFDALESNVEFPPQPVTDWKEFKRVI